MLWPTRLQHERRLARAATYRTHKVQTWRYRQCGNNSRGPLMVQYLRNDPLAAGHRISTAEKVPGEARAGARATPGRVVSYEIL
ncbi:hypothetical protein EVAR_92092_1 [Eumeta japonica]|uniref:Uncharacterized protein n=1 Tax=Eumeta variegata TaxID=151549 RepID=A0A4C1SZ67_EUMVA|nr:hypothetical protein EVAR_92092_1 [Eumeta japonica]